LVMANDSSRARSLRLLSSSASVVRQSCGEGSLMSLVFRAIVAMRRSFSIGERNQPAVISSCSRVVHRRHLTVPYKRSSRRESALNDLLFSREFEPTTPKMRLRETLAPTPPLPQELVGTHNS